MAKGERVIEDREIVTLLERRQRDEIGGSVWPSTLRSRRQSHMVIRVLTDQLNISL